jgi:hypothetical protein
LEPQEFQQEKEIVGGKANYSAWRGIGSLDRIEAALMTKEIAEMGKLAMALEEPGESTEIEKMPEMAVEWRAEE